jgi:hypothetical protein
VLVEQSQSGTKDITGGDYLVGIVCQLGGSFQLQLQL